MPASSSATSTSPQPLTVQCMRAPPISSSVTFSPTTTSAMRGEPRYIDALPSTMITMSQNAGMYAPPAALGPKSTHTCGTWPERRTCIWKMWPAWRRPGNIATCSVMRAPAESTRYTSGICRRSAVSWMRTIFSTVRGPQDPAFTVGSLAITAHVLPCSIPMPVITPSAASSGSSVPASSPSSTKSAPGSRSRAIRSRGINLCWPASLSRCRWGPPARARSSRADTASANARLRRRFLRETCPDSGAIELARKVAAKIGREGLRHGAHRLEIDARGRPERMQRLERVLGADVTGGARREGAATHTTDRSVEAADAGGIRGDHVGNAEPARVVHMQRQLIDRQRRGHERTHRADIRGSRHADRVRDPHLLDAARCQVGAQLDNARRRDDPLERTSEAHRDGRVDAAPALTREPDDVRDLVKRFVDASIHVAPVEGVGCRDGDEDIPHAVGERELESAEVGYEHAQPSQLGVQSGEHCGGVCELWHPARRDE